MSQTFVAPRRVQTNVAPTVFEDPDISFDDLDERLWVSNHSKRQVIWEGYRRQWVLKPGAKPTDVPLSVIIKYLGDPRSMHGVTNVCNDRTTGKIGVVPERYTELRRLAILYGIYEDGVGRLATTKFKDIPRDRHDPDRNLFPDMDPNDTVVPQIKVQTIHGHDVKFPIFEPAAAPYRYDTEVSGMSDMSQQLEKMKAQYAVLAEKIETLSESDQTELEVPPASEDSVGPPTF